MIIQLIKRMKSSLIPVIILSLVAGFVYGWVLIRMNNVQYFYEIFLLICYMWLLHVLFFFVIAALVTIIFLILRHVFKSGFSDRSYRLYIVAAILSFEFLINALGRFVLAYKVLFIGKLSAVTPVGLITFIVFLFTVLIIFTSIYIRDKNGYFGKKVSCFILGWMILLITVIIYNYYDELPYEAVPGEGILEASHITFQEKNEDYPVQPAVVVIGIDGLSWHPINSLASKGLLPNIEKLVKNGVCGNLEINQKGYPSNSPVLWNAMATGKSPDKHGIKGFWRYILPGIKTPIDRGPLLNDMNWWSGLNRIIKILAKKGLINDIWFRSYHLKEPALWDIVDYYGLAAGVFQWENNFPVRQINGYMLSGFESGKKLLYPEVKLKEIISRVGKPDYINNSDFHNAEKYFIQIINHYQKEYEISLKLYEEFRPHLNLVFLYFTDRIHHRFFRDRAKKKFFVPSIKYYRNFSKEIVESYKLVDRWIGGYINTSEPNTTFIVLSDHGYQFNEKEHHASPAGVFIIAGPNIKKGIKLKDITILDIAPTILSIFNLPIDQKMDGRVLKEIFINESLVNSPLIDKYEWYQRKDNDLLYSGTGN